MNTKTIYMIFGAALAVVTYFVYDNRNKTEKLEYGMNNAAEKIKKNIDISDDIVEAAIKKAATEVAEEIAKKVGKEIKNDIYADIKNRTESAVKTELANYDLQAEVRTELMKKVENVDVTNMRNEVVRTAANEAKKKFEGDLQNVINEHTSQLRDVSNIYRTISETLSPKNNSGKITLSC